MLLHTTSSFKCFQVCGNSRLSRLAALHPTGQSPLAILTVSINRELRALDTDLSMLYIKRINIFNSNRLNRFGVHARLGAGGYPLSRFTTREAQRLRLIRIAAVPRYLACKSVHLQSPIHSGSAFTPRLRWLR